MPFCLLCLKEYPAGTALCPDCNWELGEIPPNRSHLSQLIRLYQKPFSQEIANKIKTALDNFTFILQEADKVYKRCYAKYSKEELEVLGECLKNVELHFEQLLQSIQELGKVFNPFKTQQLLDTASKEEQSLQEALMELKSLTEARKKEDNR